MSESDLFTILPSDGRFDELQSKQLQCNGIKAEFIANWPTAGEHLCDNLP